VDGYAVRSTGVVPQALGEASSGLRAGDNDSVHAAAHATRGRSGSPIVRRASVGAQIEAPIATDSDFAFARLRRDGSLDPAFSRDGKLTVNFSRRHRETLLGLAL
jgi:hypothetical protein